MGGFQRVNRFAHLALELGELRFIKLGRHKNRRTVVHIDTRERLSRLHI